MASPIQIQALNDARFESLKQASESRDVDALMSWYSKDAVFTNVAQGVMLKGWDNIHAFYAQAYKMIPVFRVAPSRTTAPTPEFVASEMSCEGEVGMDILALGLKAGDTMKLKGVSLFWWKWEGDGEWNGELSEEKLRHWKIAEETAYFLPG